MNSLWSQDGGTHSHTQLTVAAQHSSLCTWQRKNIIQNFRRVTNSREQKNKHTNTLSLAQLSLCDVFCSLLIISHSRTLTIWEKQLQKWARTTPKHLKYLTHELAWLSLGPRTHIWRWVLLAAFVQHRMRGGAKWSFFQFGWVQRHLSTWRFPAVTYLIHEIPRGFSTRN